MNGAEAEVNTGNTLPMRYIPVGANIHNIEMKPGKGGSLFVPQVTLHSLWLKKENTLQLNFPQAK